MENDEHVGFKFSQLKKQNNLLKCFINNIIPRNHYKIVPQRPGNPFM